MEAQAALEQAEINLGYTEIRSPIDGRIGLATFTVGNLVQPSSGKLATIVSQDPIYVIFQVSQRNVLDYQRRLAEVGQEHACDHSHQAARWQPPIRIPVSPTSSTFRSTPRPIPWRCGRRCRTRMVF